MVQEGSDSESGLPETVPLSTSASAAKRHDHALRNFHAAEKRKIREKNRQHDERLKAQAHMRRRVTAASGKDRLYVGYHGLETGDNEGGRDMDPRLHERMTRAMGDAEDEMDEVDSGRGSGSEEEWGGIEIAKIDGFRVVADQDLEKLGSEGEEKFRSGDSDPGDGDGEDDGLGVQQPLASPSKYLPDHLFAAAFSKPKNTVRPSQTTLKTRPSRKRQSVRARSKDVVVGTRTVRTLSSSPTSARLVSRGTTLPSARINKFLATALGFKRERNTVSTFPPRWERRPSHLGMMKRTTGAPMTGFARASQH